MKSTFSVFLLLMAAPVVRAVTDEGTVTWVDGKGAFEVKTERNGTLVLHANKHLMAEELKFKQKTFPHLYKDIKAGDYIWVDWHRDPKAGKNVAEFVGIKKRGG